MRPTRQEGFTLVEVLIASSIAIASMGLLLSLFASSLDRMSRIEIQSQQLIAEKEVVGRMSLVNPAQQNAGKGKIGNWDYSWQAQRLGEFEQTTDYFNSETPPRNVALYLVNIELVHINGKTVDLQLQRLGWRG